MTIAICVAVQALLIAWLFFKCESLRKRVFTLEHDTTVTLPPDIMRRDEVRMMLSEHVKSSPHLSDKQAQEAALVQLRLAKWESTTTLVTTSSKLTSRVCDLTPASCIKLADGSVWMVHDPQQALLIELSGEAKTRSRSILPQTVVEVVKS